MARNFLREWDDEIRIAKESAKAANQAMDMGEQGDMLDLSIEAGIPLVDLPDTSQEAAQDILETKINVQMPAKAVAGPIEQILGLSATPIADTLSEAPQESSERLIEPVLTPEEDAPMDDLWKEVQEIEPWPLIRRGIEVADLLPKERPTDLDLSDPTEDFQDNPIPESFSEQERGLVEYHRNTLRSSQELTDQHGTTTVYITGVQGPDGREYLIPGYFSGKRQDHEIAAVRAALVGWQHYPSYKNVHEAEQAVKRIHDVIERDSQASVKIADPRSISMPYKTGASQPAFNPQQSDIKEEEIGRSVEIGSKEDFTSRKATAAPIPGKNPWQFTRAPEKLTRGLRNNNPGNVRKSQSFKWNGERQGSDPDFSTFQSPEMGIRAMARVLRTYRDRHGLNNITGIITRWAPPNENHTKNYINGVANIMDLAPSAPLDLKDPNVALPLVKAIIYYENGAQPYSDETIMTGIRLSGLLGGNI